MSVRNRCVFAVLFASVVVTGCSELSRVMASTWHEKHGWKAEEFFNDPQVIALCKAIEANDIAAIDRLAAAGANVNAKGKGNMTPLLWAFPDNKLERFKRLLELGADPNVIFKSDFGTRSAIMAGESVTHMACDTSFPGYFEAVFAHGGDPNLLRQPPALKSNFSPVMCVITGRALDKPAKIRVLIEKGADLNDRSSGITAAMQATSWGGQFDIVLMLLDAGADPRVYQTNEIQKLTHVVVRQEQRLADFSQPQRADFERLAKWLEDHGESLEEARNDIKRWDSWHENEWHQKANAEIAARKAREAAEKAAPKHDP